jgi:DNA polymerase Ligase (LigD)
MPRYVLLCHEMPNDAERNSHWDFMLEDNDCLLTWAFDRLPPLGENCECLALPDHRLHYLDFEGEVSRGRGHVHRVDAGEFEWLTDERPHSFVVQLMNKERTVVAKFTHVANATWQTHFEAPGSER